MARSEDVKTPLHRFAFTNDLFDARADDRGKAKYGYTQLYDKAIDLKVLKEAALAACELEWPGKAAQWLKDGLIKSPFLDGDGKQALNKKTGERNPGYAGTTFVRVMSGADFPPKLFDRHKEIIPRGAKNDPDCPLYSGCYGYAVVNAYTWENDTNGKGVSFSVSMVQAVKPGERLGGTGGPNPDKFFETIEDEGEAPAAVKSGAGAGGLFD